jgi:hypothetical protein
VVRQLVGEGDREVRVTGVRPVRAVFPDAHVQELAALRTPQPNRELPGLADVRQDRLGIGPFVERGPVGLEPEGTVLEGREVDRDRSHRPALDVPVLDGNLLEARVGKSVGIVRRLGRFPLPAPEARERGLERADPPADGAVIEWVRGDPVDERAADRRRQRGGHDRSDPERDPDGPFPQDEGTRLAEREEHNGDEKYERDVGRSPEGEGLRYEREPREPEVQPAPASAVELDVQEGDEERRREVHACAERENPAPARGQEVRARLVRSRRDRVAAENQLPDRAGVEHGHDSPVDVSGAQLEECQPDRGVENEPHRLSDQALAVALVASDDAGDE